MKQNRRRSPRVAKALRVEISNHKGVGFTAKTLNISCDGFGMQCSLAERDLLTPKGVFVVAGRPVELTVTLILPGTDFEQTEIVVAKCRVRYSRRLANDRCEIGLRYMEIDAVGEAKLLQYIENTLQS